MLDVWQSKDDNEGTTVFPSREKIYKLKILLHEKNREHYAYQLVIRGLYESINTTKIRNALQKKDVSAEIWAKASKKTKLSLPLYVVRTEDVQIYDTCKLFRLHIKIEPKRQQWESKEFYWYQRYILSQSRHMTQGCRDSFLRILSKLLLRYSAIIPLEGAERAQILSLWFKMSSSQLQRMKQVPKEQKSSETGTWQLSLHPLQLLPNTRSQSERVDTVATHPPKMEQQNGHLQWQDEEDRRS